MMCDTCRYADRIYGYPEGDTMFCCGRADDPRVPFDMEEDTICPVWQEAKRCLWPAVPTDSATSPG